MRLPSFRVPSATKPGPLTESAVSQYHFATQDVPIAYVGAPAIGYVTIIPGLTYAAGLTGVCPADTIIALMPLDKRSQLDAVVTKMATDVRIRRAFTRPEYDSLRLFPSGLLLMRPGELVRFPTPMDGISILYINQYTMLNLPNFIHDPTVAAATLGCLLAPDPRPLIRVYRSPTEDQQIGWTKGPSILGFINSIHASIAGIVQDSVYEYASFGPGLTSLTIQFIDNTVGGTARIQGAETGDFEVWWLMHNGLWAHNPLDDFSAGGRGSADATHDAETYAIPAGAYAVAVVQPSTAAAFYCVVTGV